MACITQVDFSKTVSHHSIQVTYRLLHLDTHTSHSYVVHKYRWHFHSCIEPPQDTRKQTTKIDPFLRAVFEKTITIVALHSYYRDFFFECINTEGLFLYKSHSIAMRNPLRDTIVTSQPFLSGIIRFTTIQKMKKKQTKRKTKYFVMKSWGYGQKQNVNSFQAYTLNLIQFIFKCTWMISKHETFDIDEDDVRTEWRESLNDITQFI